MMQFLGLWVMMWMTTSVLSSEPLKVLPKPHVQDVESYIRSRKFSVMWQQITRWKEMPVAAQNEIAGMLRMHLKSDREIGFDQIADLHVWSRLKSGKMTFQGHGLLLRQDVLLVNGRCAFAIEEILGCKLPEFIEDLTPEVLAKRCADAEAIIRKHPKQEHPKPDPSKN